MRWAWRILLTVAVTWLIARQVGVGLQEALTFREALRGPSWSGLALSSLVLLAGFLLGARLWGRMVAEIGGRDPGAASSVRIVLTANLGRYVPGKLWQVAGLAALSRRVGVPGTVGAAAGALVQAFTLVAAALFSIPILLGPVAGGAVGRTALFLVLAVIVVSVGVPGVLGALLRMAFRFAGLPGRDRPGLGWSFGPRWTAWHLVVWLTYGLAFVLFVRGLGFQPDPFRVAGAFAAAYLLGYLAFFAPAGVGVREGFLVAFLPPSLAGNAVGIAVLARVWMTIVELAPAGAMAVWEVARGRASAPEREREPTGPAESGRADGQASE